MPEVSVLLACACPVARYIGHVIHWARSGFLRAGFFQPMRFFQPFPPLFSLGFVVVVVFSTDVFQCDGCLFLSLCVGAHARLGSAVVPVMGALFQSRGWLAIVEALGYSMHPTSILAMQLLTSTNGHLSTTATFFCPEGGLCGEIQQY